MTTNDGAADVFQRFSFEVISVNPVQGSMAWPSSNKKLYYLSLFPLTEKNLWAAYRHFPSMSIVPPSPPSGVPTSLERRPITQSMILLTYEVPAIIIVVIVVVPRFPYHSLTARLSYLRWRAKLSLPIKLVNEEKFGHTTPAVRVRLTPEAEDSFFCALFWQPFYSSSAMGRFSVARPCHVGFVTVKVTQGGEEGGIRNGEMVEK